MITMPNTIVNENHRDWFSKVMISLITFICIGVLSASYGVFRATVVFASDLDPIHTDIRAIKLHNVNQTKLVESLIAAQRRQAIRYISAEIIKLEVIGTERELKPTEHLQLLNFKFDLKELEQ